jgi:hypothetical protein
MQERKNARMQEWRKCNAALVHFPTFVHWCIVAFLHFCIGAFLHFCIGAFLHFQIAP